MYNTLPSKYLLHENEIASSIKEVNIIYKFRNYDKYVGYANRF